MPPRRPAGRHRVGTKFATAVGAVVLGVVSVAAVGFLGLAALRTDVDRVVRDDLTTVLAVADLSTALYDAEAVALRTAGRTDDRLDASLDQVLLPRVQRQLRLVGELAGADAASARRVAAIRTDLDAYLRLRADPAADPPARIAALFGRMTGTAQELRAAAAAGAERSGAEAVATSDRTRRWLVAGTLASLLVALAVVQLLVRSLVPRIRRYARFAAEVATGRAVELLPVAGADELADLGRALNHMVDSTAAARRRDADQAEFADTLQVTATEDEAHELVRRHLERSLPGTTAVVLKRNNSENRLDAATALVPGSALAERLPGAEPRACLALRFGRTHREGPDRPPLLSCELCAAAPARSTCEPLLVGGQVIGSVLVGYADPPAPEEEARIRTSVAQAAPVLANLRNLALAEFRANNDSLTGLPNKRATDDTLKRMVAQANRSITPLAAAMLDLDHFKQVNDRFGHAKGDEVLAAVGAALRSVLRASDFAGRYGGEELLVLLPDTTAEGAVPLAERIRNVIAAITVPGVERSITVSIGIADLVQHGGDAPGLLRQADRALYTAKALGRNRVVVAPLAGPEPTPEPERAPERAAGSERAPEPERRPGREREPVRP